MHRPHRHLDREARKEREPQPELHPRIERGFQQCRHVRRFRFEIDRKDGDQHQNGARQRIEEELERRIDPALAAPDADDQEHRDQNGFEEDIEQDEIERAEHADHQRFQHEKRDHVFLHPVLDRFPARQDADRGQKGRQQDEEHRNAVDAHVIIDPEGRDPRNLLDELEIRRRIVEPDPQENRHHEGRKRCPQRSCSRIPGDNPVVAPDHQDCKRPDQRQERCQRKDGKINHGPNPPS